MEDHLAIHVINRAQIMDDALNLAKSDLLDYETALSVTGYLSKEVEYVPWASALTGGFYIILSGPVVIKYVYLTFEISILIPNTETLF